MSAQTIFVTGTTGFIGSYVLDELLREGYHVRCACRSGPKAEHLKRSYLNKKVEVVEIPDLDAEEVQEHFKGVEAVIHLASPPGRATAAEIYQGAVEGSVNILRQAEKAGVERVVMTGMIPVLNKPLQKEEVLQSQDPFSIYESCKILAEKASWEWAIAHPHVDVTFVSLPLTYGPYNQNLYLPTPAFPGVNTFLYQLIVPDGVYPFSGQYVDVRDAARAHVSALRSPRISASSGEKKIINFVAPHVIDIKQAVEVLAEERPVLKDRLIKGEVPSVQEDRLSCDYKRIEEVFGIKMGEFVPAEQTLLDTIDDYVERERRWISEGYEFVIPHY